MIIKQEPEDSFIMKTDPREDVTGLAQLENNNNLFMEEKADSNEQKQHPPRIVMEPLAGTNSNPNPNPKKRLRRYAIGSVPLFLLQKSFCTILIYLFLKKNKKNTNC
ncbi:unnamed protein product [Oikopleura dioica]|uniref:Uncharacterized protein n=1 Tax=Oikopleura dioica TaxID=34765 RepID=E4Y1T4_OIKDI|nr:unnamed protein product [Oikopleura dioica]